MPSMARITAEAPSVTRTSMGRTPPDSGSEPTSQMAAAAPRADAQNPCQHIVEIHDPAAHLGTDAFRAAAPPR
jgi:hypothetical protein